ncbi:MAG TPA: DUF742 domain-containing protein [Mycobacteriales bacterium]
MSEHADDYAESMRVVRPYTVTGGRTRPSGVQLPMEALVQLTGDMIPAGLQLERRAIVQLCFDRTLSIAEIAAHLSLPLGVIRVLVADLAQDDVLVVHTGTYNAATPSAGNLDLLASVLDGISKL